MRSGASATPWAVWIPTTPPWAPVSPRALATPWTPATAWAATAPWASAAGARGTAAFQVARPDDEVAGAHCPPGGHSNVRVRAGMSSRNVLKPEVRTALGDPAVERTSARFRLVPMHSDRRPWPSGRLQHIGNSSAVTALADPGPPARVLFDRTTCAPNPGCARQVRHPLRHNRRRCVHPSFHDPFLRLCRTGLHHDPSRRTCRCLPITQYCLHGPSSWVVPIRTESRIRIFVCDCPCLWSCVAGIPTNPPFISTS